jgi:hypothetical protein
VWPGPHIDPASRLEKKILPGHRVSGVSQRSSHPVQAIAAIPLCNEFKKPMDLLPKMLIRQMLPVLPLLFASKAAGRK